VAPWCSDRLVLPRARTCVFNPQLEIKYIFVYFLAHLSTKCSGWAIVIGLCPSSVVVRRASCVVRRPSCVVRKLFYLNIFSSETAHWILTKLHRNDPWVVPYQSCSNKISIYLSILSETTRPRAFMFGI